MSNITIPNSFSNTPANTNIIDAAQVNANYTAVTAIVNGQLDETNLRAATQIPDSKLASPSGSVWRTVLSETVGMYPGNTGTTAFALVAHSLVATGVASGQVAQGYFPSTASVAVAGKTTNLRIRAVLAVNNTAPGVNMTFALYPVSSLGGGTDQISYTLGALAGNGAAFTTPAAQSGTAVAGAAFMLSGLASVTHVLGVSLNGAFAANSYASATVTLEMQHL